MEDIEQVKQTLEQHGYEYKQVIGKGGFSSVLLCESKKYHLNFAVKRSVKHHLTQNEYDSMASLNHPNIISLYDAFNDSTSQYLVMEYCPNGTMKDKGNLPYDKFVYYSKQILQAIAFCHSRKIAHRDIKPENIFLDQYNHPKLADFGVSKIFELNELSADKCGSLMYATPEMLEFHEIDPFKADIWALGITFFYMATGEYPFPHATPDELKALIFKGEIDFDSYDMHPKIRYLIGKMTIKNHNNRPPAKRLLELPIFSDKSSSFISNVNCKRISSSFTVPKPPISMTTCPKGSESNKQGAAKTKGEILTYRSYNFHKKKVRINGRLPVETF